MQVLPVNGEVKDESMNSGLVASSRHDVGMRCNARPIRYSEKADAYMVPSIAHLRPWMA